MPDTGGRSLRTIAAVVSLGAILVGLATTVVNVAVETLSRRLGASLADTQWVLTAYVLGLAASAPAAAWASRRCGARRVWLIAVAVFLVASGLCAVAWSMGSLVAFRALQGVGGGMIVPVGQTLVVSAAGGGPLGRVMSMLNLPLVVGPVLGPAVGGLVVDELGWRWLFLVNLPLGLLALALGLLILPRHEREPAQPFDLRGLLLLSPGTVLLVYGLLRLGEGGAPAASAGPALAGALLVFAFHRHATRRRNPPPLLDVTLLRRRSLGAASVVAFMFQFIHAGALAVLPLYFQLVRGESAATTGVLVGVQGLGTLCALIVVGRLADRYGAARVAKAGLVVALLATLPLVWIGEQTSYAIIVAVLLLRGFGLSSTMTPVYAAAYQQLPRVSLPSATTAMNVISRVGASFGVAVLVVVTQAALRSAGADGAATAGAFGTTFAVVAAATVVALVAAFRIPGPAGPG